MRPRTAAVNARSHSCRRLVAAGRPCSRRTTATWSRRYRLMISSRIQSDTTPHSQHHGMDRQWCCNTPSHLSRDIAAHRCASEIQHQPAPDPRAPSLTRTRKVTASLPSITRWIVGQRQIHHRAGVDLAGDRPPGDPGSCACRGCADLRRVAGSASTSASRRRRHW